MPYDDFVTVSEKIKELRQSASLSQSKLAQESGYSLAYIKKIEKGSADPTVGCPRSIVEACGKNLPEFFESKILGHYEDFNHQVLHEKLQFILEQGGRRAEGITVNIEDLYEAALRESQKQRDGALMVPEEQARSAPRKKRASG